MGNLAFIGSHSINGVSALHSDLVTQDDVPGSRPPLPRAASNNKTNGITFRRWLYRGQSGPHPNLLVETCAAPKSWTTPRPSPSCCQFRRRRFRPARALRRRTAGQQGGAGPADRDRLDMHASIPNALFDVQIKRIHEYKRQLLNILETIALYDAMRAQPWRKDWAPRVKIFAGKAAASYHAWPS
jgi:starch phosphorylase